MSKYLLEIGVEEFPSAYINSTKKQLEEKFKKLIEENKLSVEEIKVESTPRRFAILLDGLEENKSDELISVKGPSKKIAYDNEGNPSKALLGFLRGQKAEVSDVIIKDFKGEEYIYVEKKEEKIMVLEKVKELDLYATSSNDKVIEIMEKDVNKFNGISEIGSFLGINKNEIAAIGDQDNDIPMLENSILSFAMGNSIEKVKEVCDYTVSTNENFGLVEAINIVLEKNSHV